MTVYCLSDAATYAADSLKTGNAQVIALWAEMTLRGDDIDVSGNAGNGIFAVKIKAQNVVASANGGDGAESSRRMRISGGELLGNGSWDVFAPEATFESVTCGRSAKLGAPGETLGVCTND